MIAMKRLLFLTGFLILASCGGSGNGETLSHGVAGDALTARMAFEILGEEEGGVRIGIVVRNPARVPLQSIRSWVRFDPAHARVSDLRVEDGRFSLFAPREREVNEADGFIQLGGAVRSGVKEERVLFASFRVRRIGDRTAGGIAPAILSFYDWNAEGAGHTAALSLGPHGAVNIIDAPLSLVLP